MKNAAKLTLGGLLLWAVVFVPCRLLLGESALVQSAAALGLALLPALATLIWAQVAFRNAPDMMLFAVLGGSMVRMALALGGAWALTTAAPEMFDQALWFILVVFYLGILGLEIGLLVHKLQPSANPGAQRSEPQA